MQKDQFKKIRKKLNKTQKEMAALLGISKKTVESYEQDLRNIPVNIERIVYFLLFKLNIEKFSKMEVCWDKKKCPTNIRENCVAWVAKEGFFCWFITGNVCKGEKSISSKPIGSCFSCTFFKGNLEKL